MDCISGFDSGGPVAALGGAYLVVRLLGFRLAFALFVIVELALAWMVRGNLTLNVIMLIYPIDIIKQWQMVH
jgi:hypothetical protein